MKISDFIFQCPNPFRHQNDTVCQVRIFITPRGEIAAVLTDLGDKNPGPSVTNSVEIIWRALIQRGLVDSSALIVEHYEHESSRSATFDLVSFSQEGAPHWDAMSIEQAFALIGCSRTELEGLALENKRLSGEIERVLAGIDPWIDSPFPKSNQVMIRRAEIAGGMIPKADISALVESGAIERDIQNLLKRDLSIFGEMYADLQDEYICFSEFPVAGGFVDFAVFTGRSRMEVVLIEVKGADFFLMNQNHYSNFASKINEAADQIRLRLGQTYRAGFEQFRGFVHSVRSAALAGKRPYNAFIGPRGELQVDPDKDIIIRSVVIGGRMRDRLAESKKRHEYEWGFSPPIKIESWDSWLSKLRRQ